MEDSSDRLAWTQNRDQGMGDGFQAFNDKQPSHNTKRMLQIDYYKGTKYKDALKVKGMFE